MRTLSLRTTSSFSSSNTVNTVIVVTLLVVARPLLMIDLFRLFHDVVIDDGFNQLFCSVGVSMCSFRQEGISAGFLCQALNVRQIAHEDKKYRRKIHAPVHINNSNKRQRLREITSEQLIQINRISFLFGHQ